MDPSSAFSSRQELRVFNISSNLIIFHHLCCFSLSSRAVFVINLSFSPTPPPDIPVVLNVLLEDHGHRVFPVFALKRQHSCQHLKLKEDSQSKHHNYADTI